MKIFSKPYDLLLVDDQEEIVKITSDMISKIFGKNIFNVVCAYSSKEALKYLEKINFHILITDIHMPDIPGDELARKAIAMGKGTQCIMITADNMLTTVINAYNDGSVGFICKPIDKDKLKDALKLCVDRLEFWSKSVNINIEQKKTNR